MRVVDARDVGNVDDILGPAMNGACRRCKRTLLTVKHPFKVLFSARVVPESSSVKPLRGEAATNLTYAKSVLKDAGCILSLAHHVQKWDVTFVPISHHILNPLNSYVAGPNNKRASCATIHFNRPMCQPCPATRSRLQWQTGISRWNNSLRNIGQRIARTSL
jgi:hypothetical protein